MNFFKLIVICITFTFFHSCFADGWRTERIGGMKVEIFIPKTKTLKKSLMINLHGCAQNNTDLKRAGNWREAAEKYSTVIALPQVPNGGVIAGCWDYYGRNHNTNNRHNKNILRLVSELLKREDLNIDKRRVYISGLSSGAGESFLLSCLKPDVFAGVAIVAGPSIGTNAQDIGNPTISSEAVSKLCRQFAGSNQRFFETQLASIYVGTMDYIVSQRYANINAKAISDLYSAGESIDFDLDQLGGRNTRGVGTLFSRSGNKRISLISNTGVGHSWPSGNGQRAGSFVDGQTINYPMYILKFFEENNLRAK